MKDLLKKRWFQNLGLGLVVAIAVYGLVYRDVVSRARESFQEAEKYMAWHRDPELKKRHFEDQFEKDKAALDKQLAAGALSENEYRQQLDAIEFDRDFHLSESSLKYAYQWYKDTFELFSPPESRWVREARAKAPEALDLWKNELRDQNIPFEETMFE